MRRYKIGQKKFEGTVNVTDPCYNKDVWCRMDISIKPGLYDCIIWRQMEKVQMYNETVTYKQVGVIGIYLDGHIPNSKKMKLVGNIGVDAGLAGFFNDKPDYNDDQWNEICNLIHSGDAWITDDGFFSFSGWGDGCYNVYAYTENNDVTALEIRFM